MKRISQNKLSLLDKREYPTGGGSLNKTQAKTSNSSVFNSVKSTSSYPRGGVEMK
ncbi:MAG: hypothetical protein IKT53_04860 [Bacteroidaceae bacterium]|nr:hypothetical protein [Bacteroidaceae bacterium]